MSNDQTKETVQALVNRSYDFTTDTLAVQVEEYDGSVNRKVTSGLTAKKITVSGLNTYVATAPIGTAQATAGWQAKKIIDDGAGTTTITWADGDAAFDNVATDLTSLTYS